MLRTLVIAAHADDETLGAGGFIAKFNSEVLLVVPDRIEQFTAAYPGKVVHALAYPDQSLDTKAISGLIPRIREVIDITNPSIIVTHSSAEANNDHARVKEAVVVATRDLSVTVLGMEVLSSTGYDRSFHPTMFVSLEQLHIDRKIEAYKCYGSEIKPMRSVEALIGLARYRGSFVPCAYAEAFEVIKGIL